MDVIYRFDPDFQPPAPPGTPGEAVARLRQGNDDFARLSAAGTDAQETHVINHPPTWFHPSRPSGTIPAQKPFAVVLGCSDARVSTEIIFNQPRNELFIVRMAGNVLGSDSLGSIEYAVNHVADNLRLVVVLGHSACGAVTASVDAFLNPVSYPDIASSQALRAIVDRIFASVRAASHTLRDLWGPDVVDRKGYRAALIDVSVTLSAALTAWTLRGELSPRILDRVDVMFGSFDLLTHQVWSPPVTGASEVSRGLAPVPSDREALGELGQRLGASERIRTLLGV